ncbi:MAG: hypothetical protein V4490_06615, partial [Pseudomonadota bacterium]
IATVQIEYLKKRLAGRDHPFTITEPALRHLAEAGYDPVYGARPLKRVIRQEIENPLAQQLLSGQFKPGQTVAVDFKKDHFTFTAL